MLKLFVTVMLLLPLLGYTANVAVVDVKENTVITGSLDNEAVSIASISKLMTVYTVMKAQQDLNEILTVTSNKTPNTKLIKGMTLSRLELINLALVSSDNIAAITLSENFPGGHIRFIRMMNQNAKDLNMNNTGFVEPTGLSPMNYSTVTDIVELTKAVHEFNIFHIAAQTVTTAFNATTKTKRGYKNIHMNSNSTSRYFGTEGIVTIKTGFTNAAGFCITMLVDVNNRLYNITVLGAKSKIERQRIVDTALKQIRS